MRSIKFRGKRHNGLWVYGSLVYSANIEPAIYYETGKGEVKEMSWCYVDPNTIGQFTGLKDPNGVEIYEGDLVYNAQLEFAEVKYENGAFWIYSPLLNVCTRVSEQDCVNGNIFDNPELLTAEPWKQ